MNLFKVLTSKDVFLGLVYIAFGVVYGAYTLIDLDIGVARSMGPGYFPIVLSGMMVVIGLLVIIPNIHKIPQRQFGSVNWRSVFALIVSVIVFSLLARPAGMVIATIATVLVAGLASRHATVVGTLVTALILAVFCSLVFVYGMGLPIGLFGTWFR